MDITFLFLSPQKLLNGNDEEKKDGSEKSSGPAIPGYVFQMVVMVLVVAVLARYGFKVRALRGFRP